MEIYLVGGAVRDELLGLPVTERDWVVVGATEADLIALGFQQVGKYFPVFLHPHTKEEYALARKEKKVASGYYGFICNPMNITLEEDLQRRDLTINAIARDSAGNIIDPHNGRQDLKNRWLRHISPAFSEDPVRVLRLARFSARFAPFGFRIAPETIILVRNMAQSGELEFLVPERVWSETLRALGEKQPQKFFETLRICGVLNKIFPEIDMMFSIQPHSCYDVGTHTMLALSQSVILGADLVSRFAVLVHNLGKQELNQGVVEHYSADLVKIMCNRLRIPNVFKELGIITAKYYSICHQATRLDPEILLNLLINIDALRKKYRFEQFLTACESDALSTSILLGKGITKVYQPKLFLSSVRTAIAGVSPVKFLDQGLTGLELAAALKEERLKAIVHAKQAFIS